jgi:phage terminase large subunit
VARLQRTMVDVFPARQNPQVQTPDLSYSTVQYTLLRKSRLGHKSKSLGALSNWYRPFPRQEEFHRCGAKYRLFGGAAGPGKTKALLWEAIAQALAVAGSDTLLLRRTYPELESSLLAYFRRDVPRDLYLHYNEAKHIVTWRNGSTTRFGYCRNEYDVYQYQGAEFLFIGIDELTHFTLKQWQFLTSRNRCPVKKYTSGQNEGMTVVPCMAGASNPGNIGHAWVKALWVDKTPPPEFEQPGLYNPNDYDFIRARLADNPIYANDAEYHRTLGALPEHLRRAFLEGDWNVFAGQYFDVFEFGRHTLRPEELRLEPWWPRWISIDWGFQHPSAVYWHCAVPNYRNSKYETRNTFPAPASFDFRVSSDGSFLPPRIVTYREFVQSGLSPRMLAQAIAERSGRERISEVFLSPDAFAHRTSEASIAEQLGDVLVANGLPRPALADDDRVGGWQLMYQLLESDSWLISENCRKLLECLPQLVCDEHHNREDIRKIDGDDPADAARYGLVSGLRLAGVGAGYGGCAWPAGTRFGAAGQVPPRATQESPHFSGAMSSAGADSFVVAQHAAPETGASFAPSREATVSSPPEGRPGRPAAEGSRQDVPRPAGREWDPGPPRFVTGMPLDEQIKRQITATDPTSVAIHSQRLEGESHKQFRPVRLPRRHR